MSEEEDVIAELQALVEREVEDTPGRHPLRTDRCPPLPAFDSRREGWTENQRQHASTCPYCQRTIALSWRIACPDLPQLAEYRSDPEGFPAKLAMGLHLERDGCQRCELVMRSWCFRKQITWLTLVHAGQKKMDELRVLAQGVAVAYHARPTEQFAGPGEPFEARGASENGELTVTLLEDTASNRFELVVESRDRANAGKIVQVELISNENRWEVEVTLGDRGEYGSSGARTLGEISGEFRDIFRGCAIVARWKDEAPLAEA